MPENVVHPWVAQAKADVRFAVVGAFLPGWPELSAFVLDVEERGFDAYWANDHPTRSLDTFTTLAALAVLTSRLRLMSLVSCVYYRSPVLIARGAADVDRISNGRLVLGLGMGDDVPEFAQLGIGFPPAAQRQQALLEAIEAVQGLLSGGPHTRGGLFPMQEAQLRPGPVQSPRVPVLIGGGGERFTLRQVARHADVSNFGPHEWVGGAFDPADVRRKYQVLARYCDEESRDYDHILRSHWTPLLTLAPDRARLEQKRTSARIPDAKLDTRPLFATPGQAVTHFGALMEAGTEYFLATVHGQDTETLDLLSEEVLPALRGR